MGLLSFIYFLSNDKIWISQHKLIEIDNLKMFYFLFLLPLVTSSVYNPQEYELGPNLIVNSKFDDPYIPPPTQFFKIPLSMPGWNCSHTCQVVHVNRRCAGKSISCSVSFEQGIDLLSSNTIDHYYQNIKIETSGQYYLSLLWMPPLVSPIGQVFGIIVNSVLVRNVTVTDGNYIDHLTEVIVDLHTGVNTLDIVYYKPGPDNYGVYVGQIKLQQLIPLSLSAILGPISYLTYPLLQNTTRAMNKLPGNRIFSYTLTNFLSTFDRLQFYFFHKQNLTYYSYVLLSNANELALERGSLPQNLIDNCDSSVCNSVSDAFNGLTEFLDKKRNYTEPEFFSKNENGMGFFANNLEFFFYELPMVLGTYFVFLMLFKALFNYRISKYIRKYAFYGILLFIIYEGNIEQFAFYFFSECKNLFSFNFSHKIANVLMIYFFFFLIIFSVGGLLFFTFHYRKLVKYFLEDSKENNMGAVVLQSLERAVFPLLFGAVHAILLDHLFVQTIVLFVVESCYLAAKVVAMRSCIPMYKFKVAMCTLSSMIRLCFIVTFYLYEVNNYPAVMNLIHRDLVVMYLICWLVQFLHDIVVFLWDIKEAICSTCQNKKQSRPNNKNEKKEKEKNKMMKEQKEPNSILKKQSKFNTERENKKKQKTQSKSSSKSRSEKRVRGQSGKKEEKKKEITITFNAGDKEKEQVLHVPYQDIRKVPEIALVHSIKKYKQQMKQKTQESK